MTINWMTNLLECLASQHDQGVGLANQFRDQDMGNVRTLEGL